MKKISWIYKLIIVSVFAILPSCNNHKQNIVEQDITTRKDLYTCSMHPQIIEDHPGNCPICGMQLIKINPAPVTIPASLQLESLIKPVNEFVITSLPVTTLQQKSSPVSVKAFGTIE